MYQIYHPGFAASIRKTNTTMQFSVLSVLSSVESRPIPIFGSLLSIPTKIMSIPGKILETTKNVIDLPANIMKIPGRLLGGVSDDDEEDSSSGGLLGGGLFGDKKEKKEEKLPDPPVDAGLSSEELGSIIGSLGGIEGDGGAALSSLLATPQPKPGAPVSPVGLAGLGGMLGTLAESVIGGISGGGRLSDLLGSN